MIVLSLFEANMIYNFHYKKPKHTPTLDLLRVVEYKELFLAEDRFRLDIRLKRNDGKKFYNLQDDMDWITCIFTKDMSVSDLAKSFKSIIKYLEERK